MEDNSGFGTAGGVFTLLFGILLLLQSMLSPSPAALNGNKPFTVEKVKICTKDELRGMAVYFGSVDAQRDNSFMRPKIVAPVGAYNLGDTITLNRK